MPAICVTDAFLLHLLQTPRRRGSGAPRDSHRIGAVTFISALSGSGDVADGCIGMGEL